MNRWSHIMDTQALIVQSQGLWEIAVLEDTNVIFVIWLYIIFLCSGLFVSLNVSFLLDLLSLPFSPSVSSIVLGRHL